MVRGWLNRSAVLQENRKHEVAKHCLCKHRELQFIFVGDHLRAKGWETAVRFYGAMGLPASAPASSWRGFSGSLRPSLNPYCSARRSLPHPISAYLLSFASQAGNVGRESEGPRTRLWRGEVWTGASTVGLSPGAGGGQDATYWCFSCWDGAAFMPQSPRVTPASLLSAITIPLEGCMGSNWHFRLEQPGPCPRAGQPCRQQTLASA